jgi:hypothetical protein
MSSLQEGQLGAGRLEIEESCVGFGRDAKKLDWCKVLFLRVPQMQRCS